jgi:hypothetical protein
MRCIQPLVLTYSVTVLQNRQALVLKWLSSFNASFQQLVNVIKLIVNNAADAGKAKCTIDAQVL